jgi:hypothetical protein
MLLAKPNTTSYIQLNTREAMTLEATAKPQIYCYAGLIELYTRLRRDMVWIRRGHKNSLPNLKLHMHPLSNAPFWNSTFKWVINLKKEK